jgi:hypothetical protein
MKTNQLTIAEAIEKVNTGFGSVYTKEDVVNLLNSIKENYQPQYRVLSELKDNIVDRVTDRIDEDVIDLDTAEFSIGYDNKIELERVDVNNHEFGRIVEGVIDDIIEYLKADEYTEENSVINQPTEIEG